MSKFTVKTGVAPEFISGVLTSDITTLASIFDLVDNSIDAARNHMAKSLEKIEIDNYGMPISYDGYEISLDVKEGSFSIEDNCLGISERELSNDTLLIGKQSSHQFGLGKFGVGLKRALLKLGNSYRITSDDETSNIELNFSKDELKNLAELEADLGASEGARFVKIEISDLEQVVKREFSYSRWIDKLTNELSVRYGIFVAKGLSVKLRLPGQTRFKSVQAICPQIDFNNEYLKPKIESLPDSGVDIYLETGLHTDFKLNAKYGVNNNLSDEFGWTVICNDRVIEFARREGSEFGWKRNWHSEYNGFVGYIRFYCEDVEKLPWDSTKTKIQSDSMVFLNIVDKIEELTLAYRSEIKVAKKEAPAPSSPTTRGKKKKKVKKRKKTGSNSSPSTTSNSTNSSHIHTQNWKTLLPPHFVVTDKQAVLDNLIIEACDLLIDGRTHTCTILFRALIESTFKQYVIQTKNYQNVVDYYYEYGDGRKKNHSDEYKQAQGTSLAMILDWMLFTSKIIFPKEYMKELVQCLRDLKSDHLPKMNGVVHCRNIIGELEVEQMRNETYVLLDFLVTEISNI